ncbi:hypothetical protein Salat_0661100 [Sesamum alatum]|uniref:Uncharacterized protein n=1 Tax=Sesamum alatum TaxID=300844 RepID=A0AAE1YRM7_9LAMI|nr:hypothetical protein Salat_0661100 [Sesamum alatum]
MNTTSTPNVINDDINTSHDMNVGNDSVEHVGVVDVDVTVQNAYENIDEHVDVVATGVNVAMHEFPENVNAHELTTRPNVNDASVNINVVGRPFSVGYVPSLPNTEDDFKYDDPIIADLLDRNWDEEIVVRKCSNDIIVDIEAINDMLETTAYKTPNKEINKDKI